MELQCSGPGERTLVKSKKFLELGRTQPMHRSAYEGLKERLLARLNGLTLVPTTFTWQDEEEREEVAMVGSWGQWVLLYTLKRMSATSWQTCINLPPGKHEFKFLIDGTWKLSGQYDIVDDTVGTNGNNVIEVDAPRVAQTQEEDELLCKEAIQVLEGEDRVQFMELRDQIESMDMHLKSATVQSENELSRMVDVPVAAGEEKIAKPPLLLLRAHSAMNESLSYFRSLLPRSQIMPAILHKLSPLQAAYRRLVAALKQQVEDHVPKPYRDLACSFLDALFPIFIFLRTEDGNRLLAALETQQLVSVVQKMPIELVLASMCAFYSLLVVDVIYRWLLTLVNVAEHLPVDVEKVSIQRLASYHRQDPKFDRKTTLLSS